MTRAFLFDVRSRNRGTNASNFRRGSVTVFQFPRSVVVSLGKRKNPEAPILSHLPEYLVKMYRVRFKRINNSDSGRGKSTETKTSGGTCLKLGSSRRILDGRMQLP